MRSGKPGTGRVGPAGAERLRHVRPWALPSRRNRQGPHVRGTPDRLPAPARSHRGWLAASGAAPAGPAGTIGAFPGSGGGRGWPTAAGPAPGPRSGAGRGTVGAAGVRTPALVQERGRTVAGAVRAPSTTHSMSSVFTRPQKPGAPSAQGASGASPPSTAFRHSRHGPPPAIPAHHSPRTAIGRTRTARPGSRKLEAAVFQKPLRGARAQRLVRPSRSDRGARGTRSPAPASTAPGRAGRRQKTTTGLTAAPLAESANASLISLSS